MMKRMTAWKQAAVLGMAVCMTAGLVGCGSKEAADTTADATTEAADTETTEAAEDGDVRTVRIGIGNAYNPFCYLDENEELAGMGTTMVVAFSEDRQLYVANVGDSRLYVIGEKIQQITRDHSLVQEMVRMGELDPEQARKHPKKNIITRALGAEKTVDIDFFDLKLEPGDVVLMCSDGLSNMVEDSQLREIISDTSTDLDEKGRILIREANRNGGKDNIAIVLVEPFADEVKAC